MGLFKVSQAGHELLLFPIRCSGTSSTLRYAIAQKEMISDSTHETLNGFQGIKNVFFAKIYHH
jgi:hypothetical protein